MDAAFRGQMEIGPVSCHLFPVSAPCNLTLCLHTLPAAVLDWILRARDDRGCSRFLHLRAL